MSELNGTNRRTLLTRGVNRPRSIVTDPANGWVTYALSDLTKCDAIKVLNTTVKNLRVTDAFMGAFALVV